MDATIELDKENNFVIQLSRINDQGLPMMLSAFAVPLNALQDMIDSAAIKKNKFIPTIFNSVDDEEDFFQTLNSRGLNGSIKVALISNLDGFWFEIGNETLKAGLVYGPIRFKTISKIIELDWPIEVYLPIYKEENESDEKELVSQFKKMTKKEQENLMRSLEEQEKRGEI
jgi:hypothetical protein